MRVEAFEREGCVGTAVARTDGQAAVVEGQVTQLTLALSARDADGDGYVEAASGGSDCRDDAANVSPDGTERCDGVDNNCDGQRDEGFSVGQLCTTAAGCQSAWACAADGTRSCTETQGQWRPDTDGDGFGSSTAPGKTACLQPAGYVANALDCNDGNNKVNPNAAERCDGVDNNCDGAKDEGFNVGAACTSAVVNGKSCAGARACLADGTAACNAATPVMLYPDADGDGQGSSRAAAEPRCANETAGWVANNTDCDDGDATVKKQTTGELCDGKDNTCDGVVDEGFNLGASCNVGGQPCAGKLACNAAKTGTQCVGTAKVPAYPDDDRDTRGKAGVAAVNECLGPDFVTSNDDCDDGDPFVKPGAPELCDHKDNNCNGSVDEQLACRADTDPWQRESAGGTTAQWYSVSLFGNGGVAVAGQGSQVLLRVPGASSFGPTAQSCVGEWQGVWADASSGKLFLGGELRLGVYNIAQGTCNSGSWGQSSSYSRGIFGIPKTGGQDVYAVGEVRPVPTGQNALPGRSVVWDGAENGNNATTKDHTFPLYDVHGTARSNLLAVGGTPGTKGRIYQFDTVNNFFAPVGNGTDQGDQLLRAVWALHPKLAYAVGDANTVMRFDGASTVQVAGPLASASEGDLVALVAFGRNALYAVAYTPASGATPQQSRVFQFDGSTWRQVGAPLSGVRLRDLAGTSPENLWVVGEDGWIAHWP
nr:MULTISPECIES: putative metal-binding motif-containing protein [Myxococcaceae]